MMMGPSALFLLATVHLVFSQSVFDDPCYLMTWNDQTEPGTDMIPLAVPQQCTGGEIHWNYPKGSLHLSATRANSQFTLCVGESWATMIAGVNDITGGRNVSLSMPTKDHPACTQSQNGQADLQVMAEDTMYYMTALTYSIE